MGWVEVIQLKSFTGEDRKDAEDAFHHLTFGLEDRNFKEVGLFENPALHQELIIVIEWHGDVNPQGKSRLGLQLAAGFSEFGFINHFGWRRSIVRIIQPHAEAPTQT